MFYRVLIHPNRTHNAQSRSVTFKQDVYREQSTPEILQGLETGQFEAVTAPVFWSQQITAIARQQRNSPREFSFEVFSCSLALQSSLRLAQELHPGEEPLPYTYISCFADVRF